MVSATDVITYVGVPLAVLGVMPILYTFATALYTRIKLQRILRRNNLEDRSQIRARLMTGVVEIDLPTFQLEPHPRTDQRYWSVLNPKAIDGALWSCFDWFEWQSGRVLSRMQRSDRLKLPEARVNFSKLVAYLQDRGASPCREGFRILRQRGLQTPVGTHLMEVTPRDTPLTDETQRHPVMMFAKPGEQHGSISLALYWPKSLANRTRNMLDPSPSCITGSFGAEDQKKQFIIQLGASGIDRVAIQSKPASDMGQVLESEHHAELAATGAEPWDCWFACAVEVVYGFKGRTYFSFRPSRWMILTAQKYDISVGEAVFLRLLDSASSTVESRFEEWMNSCRSIFDAGPIPQRWASRQDLANISTGIKTLNVRVWLLGERVENPLLGKSIGIPELSCVCLQYLSSHPITIDLLQIGRAPVDSSLESYMNDIAEEIICSMLSNSKFAKNVNRQVLDCFKVFDKKERGIWPERPDKVSPRCRPDESVHFCCAVVLLANIGLRAEYLLTGEDIEHCEKEWIDVYLC